MALFELHIHLHGDVAMGSVEKKLDDIRVQLTRGAKTMAQVRQDIADFSAQVDAATSEIAARIQRLVDATNLSADEKAKFAGIVTTLQEMGKDPVNPIPPMPA